MDQPILPEMLNGNFSDDYDIQYTINDTVWLQYPNTKYHILFVDTNAQYILAKNDINNPTDKALYTRIDFMYFQKMSPYTWGYCLSVFNAHSLEEAREKAAADRSNPRTGCNGYPFSRMKK
ncbi:MAG: hypothetical protein JSS67_01455 [Bacteroidetes bacterium]|nr:hypothetical protein [Bacteroidota bacterium]